MNQSEIYMQLALDKAWEYQGLTYPNPAVGAVVTHSSGILAIEAHQRAGTSHAEVLALIAAYEKLSGQAIDFDRFDARLAHEFLLGLDDDSSSQFFSECDIYVTLEPCSHEGRTPSCASLLHSLHLAHITIGTKDPIEGHGGGMDILESTTVGVLEDECLSLLEPFLIWQSRAFVLFKLAQTTNGRIGGGYLSSAESLEHVHQMREVCDKLIIGGGTVRSDRPTLDCRFSGGMAPDILIYSREDDFDRDIPLFGVVDRSVEIGDDISFLDTPSFVIIEGGDGMLNAMIDRVDWMLIYQTPKLSTNPLTYSTNQELTFLHSSKKGVDMMQWCQN